ncbi:MAG: HD-GYP domain-containing protein [Synergistaceae bacterium]|jgi:HD-GYP domain-containing protein (c-di-GMP phosphodiesterase class II)|nr:HD-GYP domain-containing protein [Synergistaceae bacterium]
MSEALLELDEEEVGVVPQSQLERAEHTVTIKVPVKMLAQCEGVVATEVLTKSGAVILPAGVDITLFESTMAGLIAKMLAHGIEWVYLHTAQNLSDNDINEIIEHVYSAGDTLISKEKARDVVKHMDSLFRTIQENDMQPEMVTSVVNMGNDLTEDILRNPSVAFSLGKVHEADEYTFVHSFNVSVLAGYLTNRIFPNDRVFLQKIITGGLLHDMGKAKIPIEVLNKPGPLTQDEFKEMKRHPSLGLMLAMHSGVKDEDILAVIGCHHEKWSGKGYPVGRKGDDIPLGARIAAVADVFDALTAKRVYKNPMSSRNAITIILKDSGVHFDSKVARELLVSLGLYPPGSIVSLSDGRVGVVVSGGGRDLMRPVVMIRSSKKPADEIPEFVDLKNAGEICINQCIGHADKREIGYDLGKE